jgi:hypothetical protein
VLQVAGEIDDGHPPASNFAQNLIPPGKNFGYELVLSAKHCRKALRSGLLEERICPFAFGYQSFQLCLTGYVVTAQLDDELRAALGWRVEDCIKERLQAPPLFG